MKSRKNSVDWTKAGRKSWDTRRKNTGKKRSQDAGKKAWKETIRPTEYGYIDELVKTHKAKQNEVFHHEGLPDLMVITESGKLRFYEIKPSKAPAERRLLNPNQNRTIRNLLRNKMVEEVNIVWYVKGGKKPVYTRIEKITPSNIDDYSF